MGLAEKIVQSGQKIFSEDYPENCLMQNKGIQACKKFDRKALMDFIDKNCTVYHYTKEHFFKEHLILKFHPTACYVYSVYDDCIIDRKIISQKIYCPSYNNRQWYDVNLEEDKDIQTKEYCPVGEAKKALNKLINQVEKKYNVELTIPVINKDQELKEAKEEQHCSDKIIYSYHNKKFNGLRVRNVYGYDINSAYTTALIELKDKLVWSGNKEADREFTNGLANLCLEWYNGKKNAKNSEEKNKYKLYLNSIVGILRNKNVKAYVQLLDYHTNKMKQYVKQVEAEGKTVLYAYTDSIYTIGPCKFLEGMVGTELGKFKREHVGCSFALNPSGTAYQVDNENPKWKGKPVKDYEKFKEVYGRNVDITSLSDIRDLNAVKTKYIEGV